MTFVGVISGKCGRSMALLHTLGFTKISNIMPPWIMFCLVLVNNVTWTSFKLLALYILACYVGWIY